jgi:uncharacterized protein involved in high-affinity Fe2+ transport
MNSSKLGIWVAAALFGAVAALLLVFALRPGASTSPQERESDVPGVLTSNNPLAGNPLAHVEKFIGEVERPEEGILIRAVYLPALAMEGMHVPMDPNVIHLEADIAALEGNPNGFPAGSWIPYLTVRYRIVPDSGEGDALEGQFLPMVARDGPHYGATIQMPGPGRYRLTYFLEPPGSTNFGRHSDPVTGVGPWWKPFSVEFSFAFEPVRPLEAAPTTSSETP